MLDAFSSIDDSGAFKSTIPSVTQRFGTMVGGLTTGRSGKHPYTSEARAARKQAARKPAYLPSISHLL